MLGVTMEESGVSKIVTIRLEHEGTSNQKLPDIEPFEEEEVEEEKDVYIPPHPPKRNKHLQQENFASVSLKQSGNEESKTLTSSISADASEKAIERDETDTQ